MVNSSLYYPFTQPSRGYLKTALFLWDTMDVIVPYKGFSLQGRTNEETEAIQIVGRTYVPTDQNKRDAHEELESLCKSTHFARLKLGNDENPDYEFYPQKLMPETWDMLRQSKFANTLGSKNEVTQAFTGKFFGYLMMSILGACCNERQKTLVTDETDTYKTLSAALVDDTLEFGTTIDWHSKLLAVTLKSLDLKDAKLVDLIKLRKNEDQLLFELRKTFVNAITNTAQQIFENANNPNAVLDLLETYERGIERDFKELKLALWKTAEKTILTKEVGLAVTGLVVGTFEPVWGSLLAIGGLKGALNTYQDNRRKVLKEHQSSWLYIASHSNFSWL